MDSLLILVLLVCLLWAAILLAFNREVALAWAEPALRFPVLIVESDDWSPGPESDGEVLRRISGILRAFRDSRGRQAVMTLGVALSVPDAAAMRQSELTEYRQKLLRDPDSRGALEAMLEGAEQGVFAIQLHGMSHYWPDSLCHAARTSQAVRAWLAESPWPRTEKLPSPLQSRWVDAGVLPSRNHGEEQILVAAQAEVDEFKRTFGVPPEVVVPPTFVWTEAVERAWKRAGLGVLVCPGRQFVGRDAQGRLTATGGTLVNGQTGPSGIAYVVRDSYFEPERGHRAVDALEALRIKTREARPTMLEMHRSNFIGTEDVRERSIAELRALLETARRSHPRLRFASTAEIGRAMFERDPAWVHDSWIVRAATCFARLRSRPRVGRLIRWSGLGVFSALLTRVAAIAISADRASTE